MPGIADQYRIIATGGGWRRRVERGRLRVDGSDRHSFLQALLTNDVGNLQSGRGSYNAYLTPQGRMIADLHVFAREDHFIADVPVSQAAALASTFDNLIFTEQVTIADVSETTSQITLAGGEAASIASRALDVDAAALRALPVWAHLPFGPGFLARTDDCNLESFDIVVPAHGEADLRSRVTQAGGALLSDELWNALRIDAGRPEFGIDMDTDTIPLEAGLLDRAISTGKGCYVGQEVIIRVLHRGGGRVARKLVRIAIDSVSALPAPGSTVRVDDRDVGRITSAALALDGAHAVALGYVHRDFATPGQVLALDRHSARARITGFGG